MKTLMIGILVGLLFLHLFLFIIESEIYYDIENTGMKTCKTCVDNQGVQSLCECENERDLKTNLNVWVIPIVMVFLNVIIFLNEHR